MAKKKQNPNLPQETLARARRELYGTSTPLVAPREDAESAPAPAPRPAAPRPATGPVDLHAQYAYVIRDLRNMGILAAVFIGVLVILSLIV